MVDFDEHERVVDEIVKLENSLELCQIQLLSVSQKLKRKRRSIELKIKQITKELSVLRKQLDD